MNFTTTLTMIAGLAAAGAALGCECSPASAPADAAVQTLTLTGTSSETNTTNLKVVITDGDARYWVNGEEVSKAEYEKVSGQVSVSAAPARVKGRAKWSGANSGAVFELEKQAPPAFPAAEPVKPVRLGVVLGQVNEALAGQIDVDPDDVILIERVMDGTPAAKAGLKSYDVLVEFDDHRDLSVDKLRKLISVKRPGDKANVLVLRDGEGQKFTVKFDGEPDMVFGAAPTPPAPDVAPEPRDRFFAVELDEKRQEQVEQAMRLAEEYAEQAQEQALRWTKDLKHGLGQHAAKGKFAVRVDPEYRAEIEQAMAELHETLSEHDIDINLDFDFDDFPRLHFIEADPDNNKTIKNRAAVIEKRLHERHDKLRQEQDRFDEHNAKLKLHAKKLEEKAREHARVIEREHEATAERQIERLEKRIEQLERMLERAIERLESREPRGVRN